METNALIIGIIEVAVLLLLVYAVYVVNGRRAAKAVEPAPKPASTVVEPPKTEAKPAPEVKVVVPRVEATVTETVPQVVPPAPVIAEKAAEAAPVPAAKPKKPRSASKRGHGVDIIDIEGIGKKNSKKLHNIGIYNTVELLEAGATPKGRAELAGKTGLPHELILEWVNLSDLFRVNGVGEEYSDLLEEAGIDTVVELSHRNAEHLHTKILEVNKEKKLVRRPPSQAVIEGWIEEAKKLPRVVEY